MKARQGKREEAPCTVKALFTIITHIQCDKEDAERQEGNIRDDAHNGNYELAFVAALAVITTITAVARNAGAVPRRTVKTRLALGTKIQSLNVLVPAQSGVFHIPAPARSRDGAGHANGFAESPDSTIGGLSLATQYPTFGQIRAPEGHMPAGGQGLQCTLES